MSKLNMFSIESVDTYNKFKLQDGNLYMNNSRVGIEEFKGGKNIEISNHSFNLSENVSISGDMVVDNNITVNTIFANSIIMDFFEVDAAKIDTLETIDISTEFIRSNDLSVRVHNDFTIDSRNLSVSIADLSINANDVSMNSRHVSISSETLYVNNGFLVEKYGRYTDICGETQFGNIVRIDNLEVTGTLIQPADTLQGQTFIGTLTAASDLNVSGGLFTFSTIDAVGVHTFVGDNTLNGTNVLTGSTTIDHLQLQNGLFDDISVSRLNVTSACDMFIDGVFRIRNGMDICMVDIYEWNPDLSNNLYYDGNVIIGSNLNSIDASLNVFGPVDIMGVLDVNGFVKVLGKMDVSGDVDISGVVDIVGILNVTSNTISSDERLKSNVNDLTNGLDIIRQIKPKLYDKTCGSGHIKESGVMAQDILEIDALNYLVSEHKGMYGLNYNSLHMYSLLAVQELDKKLDKLTESIAKSMALIEQKLNILYNMRR